jgi:hypothetical protein
MVKQKTNSRTACQGIGMSAGFIHHFIHHILINTFMKKNALVTIILLLLCTPAIKAQSGCAIQGCLKDSFNISTGYNQLTSSYVSPLALEPGWQLVSAPTNITVGSPACWVITPHSAWGNFPTAKWVSAFQNNLYSTNNLPLPASPFYGSFKFQRCFCLCQSTAVRIKYDLMADDETETFVDGILLKSGIVPGTAHYTLASKLSIDTVITLSAGQHCITVDLYNVGSTAMGFAVQGYVVGANMLKSVCCDSTGRICGTKIKDTDCNGTVNGASDPGLAGWMIILKNSSGVTIATAYTDPQGNYCFTGLRAGKYKVEEVNQSGWTQTYPPSGSHSVILPAGGAVLASFGNCMQPTVQCGYELSYDIQVKNCMVHVTPILNGLPPGWKVVSTEWTFGDNSSSDEFSPIHYYTATGTYTICLTVTIFDGNQCCTSTICTDVNINKACDRGCTIDAELLYSFNELNCTYYFQSNIINTGSPITSVSWNFGDGTTSNSMNPTHQFPGPGAYHVCVYIFAGCGKDAAHNPDGTHNPDNMDCCCYKMVCKDIIVNCDPCDGGGKGTGSLIKPEQKNNGLIDNFIPDLGKDGMQSKTSNERNMIVLNQNVPNPFAEHTVITYNIPSKFSKAQIIFTIADGRVIKAFDIKTVGEGSLHVYADDLSNGIYSYTLVVDGKTIDSKNMIKQ